MLAYEETEDWRRRLSETVAGLIEDADELTSESDEEVAIVRERLLEMRATIETMRRRILVVARAS